MNSNTASDSTAVSIRNSLHSQQLSHEKHFLCELVAVRRRRNRVQNRVGSVFLSRTSFIIRRHQTRHLHLLAGLMLRPHTHTHTFRRSPPRSCRVPKQKNSLHQNKPRQRGDERPLRSQESTDETGERCDFHPPAARSLSPDSSRDPGETR